MAHNETTGAREYRVSFLSPPPGSPFKARGELVWVTRAPDDAPERVELRFNPAQAEFLAALPSLAARGSLPAGLAELRASAAHAQPVVIYEAVPALVSKLPGNIADLDAFHAALGSEGLFDPRRYRLVAIEFLTVKPD